MSFIIQITGNDFHNGYSMNGNLLTGQRTYRIESPVAHLTYDGLKAVRKLAGFDYITGITITPKEES